MTIEEIYSVIDEATHLTFDFLLNTFYAAMIAAVCTPHTDYRHDCCGASKARNNINASFAHLNISQPRLLGVLMSCSNACQI